MCKSYATIFFTGYFPYYFYLGCVKYVSLVLYGIKRNFTIIIYQKNIKFDNSVVT